MSAFIRFKTESPAILFVIYLQNTQTVYTLWLTNVCWEQISRKNMDVDQTANVLSTDNTV